MKRLLAIAIIIFILTSVCGCSVSESSDNLETKAQEQNHVTTSEENTDPLDDTNSKDLVEKKEDDVVIDYSIGEIVRYGCYEQDGILSNGAEDLEWIVVDIKDDSYLLISRYAIDSKPYNNTAEEVTWEQCTLRKWLNSDFFEHAFTEKEKEHIVTSKLANPDNPDSMADGGNTTNDKVFVLSYLEASYYFVYDSVKTAYATEYAKNSGSYTEADGRCGWWLRTPGGTNKEASRVNINGQILTGASSEGGVERTDYSVRPAIWLKAK